MGIYMPTGWQMSQGGSIIFMFLMLSDHTSRAVLLNSFWARAAVVLSIGCRPGELTENTDSGHSGEENAKALLRDQQFILEAG